MIAGMPTKRDVLEQLKRHELVAAVKLFQASSHKAAFSAILEPLGRAPLVQLCRALERNDSGCLKAKLVERLAGNRSVDSTSAVKNPASADNALRAAQKGQHPNAENSAYGSGV